MPEEHPPIGPIVFYFPFRTVGGVSVLFLRLAEHFGGRMPVFVADYSDGYMARRLPATVKLIRIDAGDPFPPRSVFVFESNLPWRFPFASAVDPLARAFFWNLHPLCFDPRLFAETHESRSIRFLARTLNLLSGHRRKRAREIIDYLLERDALAMMDRENVRSTASLTGRDLEVADYLPVPVPPAPMPRRRGPAGAVPRCAWLGRIVELKYTILEHLMVRLSRACGTMGPMRLLVIGSGEYLDHVRRVAARAERAGLGVEFAGELEPAALPGFLSDNVDILFAMGSSALEGARLGIPVFLTDYSPGRIAGNYRFRLIHDNSGYCLGEQISEHHLEAESTLEESLRQVLSDYEAHGTRCYEYWKSSFSLESVAPRLLDCLQHTRATFGEMSARNFFTPDRLSVALRSAGLFLRGRLRSDIVGFRNDC